MSEVDEPLEPGPAAWRSRLLALGVLAGLVALGVWLHRQGGFELDPRALREQIEALGPIAPVAFAAACALRPALLLPSWVLMSAGGLLFGVFGGIVWGSLGFSLGAVLAFGVARGLGREAVARRLHGRAARFDQALRQRGASWLMVYTAIPITPLTPVHASAGLSGIRVSVFLLAVFSGFLPRLALFSLFGDSLNSLLDGEAAPAVAALVAIAVASALGISAAQRIARARDAAPDDDHRAG